MDGLVNEVIAQHGGTVPVDAKEPSSFLNFTADGVPRPDKPLSTLRWVSTLGGALGADYFYLGSVNKGLLKLLPTLLGTIVGTAASPVAAVPFAILAFMWYVWDVSQVWFEKDFVLKFGMSAFGNLATGIGQGRITDQETLYGAPANFMTWVATLLFGFTGLDSLYTNRIGNFLVKILTLGVTVAFALAAWSYYKDGHIIATVLWGLLAAVVGLFVVGNWATMLYTIATAPTSVLKDGVQISQTQDNLYNGFMTWVLQDFPFGSAEFNKTVINYLKFDGLTPQQAQDLFTVKHASEEKPTLTNEKAGDAIKAFAIFLASVILVIPFAILAFLNKSVFAPLLDVIRGFMKAPTADTSLPSSASTTPSNVTNTGQEGGGSSLTTESLVLGTTALALIVGGVIKGTVDHLFVGV